MFSNRLRVTSLAFGAVYFAALPFAPYPGSAIPKGLAIGSLAVLAWVTGITTDKRLLALALALSTTGDVLLDLDPARLFVAGLCAFLAAHIVYTILFVRNRMPRPGLIGAAAVLLYAVLFAVWLAPRLGTMTIPVIAYVCVISAMVVSALCSRLPLAVAIGAVLFLASDSLLAVGKFVGPFAGRNYLVWGTYYAAQYLIATGVLAGIQAPTMNRKMRRAVSL